MKRLLLLTLLLSCSLHTNAMKNAELTTRDDLKSYTIRHLELNDTEKLITFYKAIDPGTELSIPNACKMLVSYRVSELCLVAEINKSTFLGIIGGHYISYPSDELVCCDTIFVHPEAQGLGFATGLLNTFITYITQHRPDIRAIKFTIDPSNNGISEFYEKNIEAKQDESNDSITIVWQNPSFDASRSLE